MNFLKISVKLFLLCFFTLGVSLPMFSQKPIYGNGNIQTDVRKVKMFTKLNIELNGDIIIHLGEQPKVIVETDENILANITTSVSNNELLVTQKKWPEPSKKFIVHVYTPVLSKITSDSWANIDIHKINQKKLELFIELGSIVASGSVQELTVHSEQAKIDLENLTVGNAKVKLTGYADMVMCCAESLIKDINDGAELKVLSLLSENEEIKTSKEVKYINFEIVNNSWSRNHFYVQGPKERRFSYGFPMNPLFSRAERWPIGTKVYQVNLLGIKKLLVEIEEKDENTKVKLFED